MARLVWTERAQVDFDVIVAYVAAESPIHAKQVSKRILQRVALLPDLPRQGRQLPENDTSREVREVFVYRWRIIYEIIGDEMFVLSIMHGARLIENTPPL